MKRRTVLQTAAGAAVINLLMEGTTMAQENQAAGAIRTDADAILERLMTKDVPAAVAYDDRMRTLIAVASLTAQDESDVLEEVAAAALKRGIDPLAMREAAMQAMAYSGSRPRSARSGQLQPPAQPQAKLSRPNPQQR